MKQKIRKIIILGGYGVFGKEIALTLAKLKLPNTTLEIVGRNGKKAEEFANKKEMGATFSVCDLQKEDTKPYDLQKQESSPRDPYEPKPLPEIVQKAFLVIHAAGPFSGQDYRVAQACLKAGAHYLDIADGRKYVTDFQGKLHKEVKHKNLFFCTGASTTPAVTSAMVKELKADGLKITAIHSTLSPGNQNPRGTATVATVLGYLGNAIPVMINGEEVDRFGWFDEEKLTFPDAVQGRKVYTVDSPDIALFPKHFEAQTVTFKAGLELNMMNQGLTLLAHLHRRKLLPNLTNQAKLLTQLSLLSSRLGSPQGAIVVSVEGEKEGQHVRRTLAVVALKDGPLVAAAPAVLLTKHLLDGKLTRRGAFTGVGLVSFTDLRGFLDFLDKMDEQRRKEQGKKEAKRFQIIRADEDGWSQ